jgi:hypothetical protein
MIPNPIEYSESLHVGTVEFVAPNEIKVALDIESPDNVALNSGTPRPFPRINGYILIPNDDGFLVGQIEWLTIEYSPYPKRRGMQDFGLVDLPYPIRKISLNPIGTLQKTLKGGSYILKRGVEAFPSVGDSAFLPTQVQLKSIIESSGKRRVKIGTSPLADDADVCVDPDRIFGRHLAVLGNTGSGKSCSVAGIIRWSLEEIQKNNSKPNARFIILDPNGEYERAFQNEKGILQPQIFKAEVKSGENQLKVPLWFWNSDEWSSFSQASPKTQRPTLIHALRSVKDGNLEPNISTSHEMRNFLRTVVSIIKISKNKGDPWGGFGQTKGFYQKIKKWLDGGLHENISFSDEENKALAHLNEYIKTLVENREIDQYPHYDFTLDEINELQKRARDAHEKFGGREGDLIPIDADTPREFDGDSFIKSIEASAELLNVSEHVETMLIRMRTLLGNSRMKSIISESTGITLDGWLSEYIGADQSKKGNITIIDLSLVPSEIVHIVTAVIARMIFEALQRYQKASIPHSVYPTVLVMEEAHTFIKKYDFNEENQNTASICCKVFERIAREGRKFGLGLVLSSQRPSELSPTVLSQCNTFLLHRITNDRDQDIVNRYVPDSLRGLLRDLPSLPSQNAILLGWASELPVLVKMNELPKNQQPQSDDPDFWDVWTRTKSRVVDWKVISDNWQEKDISSKSDDET